MKALAPRLPLLAAFACAALAACSSSEPSPVSTGPALQIAVAPLELEGVLGARYRIEVFNQAGAPVWSKTVTSGDYGDGRGSLTYVGTCDADSSPNRVVLTVEALYGAGGDPAALIDPTTWNDPSPLERIVPCLPNQDALVAFDLVIARDAGQGFFDIGVDFDDIFCSAKLDCVDAAGQPLRLLHDGDTRSTTVVMALACTSGADSPTYLHMSDVTVTCDGVPHALQPLGTTGNQGAEAPHIFQWASYRGDEQLEPYDKCYWNTAIGLDLDAISGDCRLSATATATTAPLTGGATDAATTYPFIRWDAQLTTGGALSCTKHPLDGGLQVTTQYTRTGPEAFAYTMACGDAPSVTTQSIACSGAVDGVAGVEFTPTATGVTVSATGSQPVTFPLPSGYRVSGCCADPCCTTDL